MQIIAKDSTGVSRFRRFLSQFVAATASNILLFDLGLCSFFPGILIPVLSGIKNEHNQNETLWITPDESSWLGSVAIISAPLGTILTSFLTDALGRKRSMMLANVPMAIAWFMMYNYSDTLLHIFIATLLMGFGTGLVESPVITYVGEISESEYRSFLMAYTFVGLTFGPLFVSILNILMPWRLVALVCLIIPILSIIIFCVLPESPSWLLSRNRPSEAEKALCWLRGWTNNEEIAEEFQALQSYADRSKACGTCIKQQQKCSHGLPTLMERLHEFKRQKTLKPFFIVISLICIIQVSRIVTIKPYIVQIFHAYGAESPDQAAAILNFTNNIANIICLFVIHFTGKRRLCLSMLAGVFVSFSIICGYSFLILPNGYNSFDPKHIFYPENKMLTYIPFVCIILGSFFAFCGVNSISSQLLSELFSFKVRGTVTGLVATFGYLMNFIITKTYKDVEITFSLAGVTLFSSVFMGLGLILMYYILPETKRRTLEDIEVHFSDNSKKITNRKIHTNKSIQQTDILSNSTETPKILPEKTVQTEVQNV